MDKELLFYIIFVVIALLTRVFKKKGETPPAQAKKPKSNNSGKPPISFEDLLKEFEQGGSSSRKQQPEPVEEYEFAQEYPDDDEIQQVYESSVRDAERMKTIDELVDLEDNRHSGSFRHFVGYAEHEKEEEENEFMEMLRDADGAKKAIVMSEIINRKY